jgi:hypothetical protein
MIDEFSLATPALLRLATIVRTADGRLDLCRYTALLGANSR